MGAEIVPLDRPWHGPRPPRAVLTANADWQGLRVRHLGSGVTGTVVGVWSHGPLQVMTLTGNLVLPQAEVEVIGNGPRGAA